MNFKEIFPFGIPGADNKKYGNNKTTKKKYCNEINRNESTLTPLDSSVPGIEELYENANIFITGSTGFVGKVLVEKLLRSCPGTNNIYILLRKKLNQDESERLKKMLNIPLYDKLRSENPKAFNKIRIIGGNLEQLNMGISKEDEQFLIDNIHFVFHCGASVRFDDSLQQSILLNTRGTREMVKLAKKMKHLKAFVHVSTAYTNCDYPVIEEKIYPPKADWRLLIKMAETMKPEQMNVLEKKFLNDLPNTYVFSKSLAEIIIHENKDNFPCVIFRPAIVCNSANDPIPGWVDNFNGPIGLAVGYTTGLLHTILAKNVRMEYIQVDLAVRVIIVSAWYQYYRKDWNNCLIINGGISNRIAVTMCAFTETGANIAKTTPFRKLLWYPFIFTTSNEVLYLILLFFFHIMPGFIFDFLFYLSGSKQRVMKLYRRIHYSNWALKHFMLNEWKFIFDNFHSLDYVMKTQDKLKFSLDYSDYDINELLKNDIIGIKKYIMKEELSEENSRQARKNLRNMTILHFSFLGILSICFIYLFWQMSMKSNPVAIKLK